MLKSKKKTKNKKLLWTLLCERRCNVFTALRPRSALLVSILVCMWECSGWRNKKAYLLPRWNGSQLCKRTLIVGQEVERVIYWLGVGASIPTCLLTTCQSLFGQDTKYTSQCIPNYQSKAYLAYKPLLHKICSSSYWINPTHWTTNSKLGYSSYTGSLPSSPRAGQPVWLKNLIPFPMPTHVCQKNSSSLKELPAFWQDKATSVLV